MKQLSIKPEKCIGCRTCELVCSFGHFEKFNPKMANVTVFEYEEAAVAVPVMCLQCEEPSCLEVCPVKAISRDENGAVVMNYSKCIGCRMCMNACPLGNITYHPEARRRELWSVPGSRSRSRGKADNESAEVLAVG